jgi:hypothetical protein
MNIWEIVAVIIAIAVLVWFAVIQKIPAARKIALALVIDAESKYGSGTGEIKYEYVIGKLYPLLPAGLKLFVSQKFIDKLIEGAVTYMKEHLGEENIQMSVY